MYTCCTDAKAGNLASTWRRWHSFWTYYVQNANKQL